MGEELELEQGDQDRLRPAEAGLELQMLDHQKGNQGRPDHGMQRMGTSPHGGLEPGVLLQGLEQGRGPLVVLVNLRNCHGSEDDLVRSSKTLVRGGQALAWGDAALGWSKGN